MVRNDISTVRHIAFASVSSTCSSTLSFLCNNSRRMLVNLMDLGMVMYHVLGILCALGAHSVSMEVVK